MDVYLQIAICFAAIGVSALLAEKTRMFFAPFYIIAGFIFGPNALALVTSDEIISLLGEIGVVFLLFFLGLEFSLHTLMKQKKTMLIAGGVDFGVNFLLGLGLGLLLGLNILQSLIIAAAIYMSSSGIITKSLIELQVNKKPEGHLIMGIMVFEDLVMIFFLVLVSSGLMTGGAPDVLTVLIQLGKSLLFCAVLLLIGKKFPRLPDKLLGFKKRELLLLVFFGLVLLVTAMGKLLGISAALGAFFLGTVFSGSKNVKRIENTTVILRDLFGSVFFFSFGMMMKIENFLPYWDILIYFVLIAIIGKVISGLLITRLLKCEQHMSLFIGFITVPRGEFSLLISDMAAGSIPFIGPIMVLLVLLTTAVSSLVLKLSKMLCKVYNVCIIFPRSRLKEDESEWGEVD